MFGIASLPVPLSTRSIPERPKHEYTSDPRLKTLHHFFAQAECPAASYAIEFLRVADEYALDWRLLPSLSFIESTGGKASLHNNLFGWDEGRARFASPLAAIQSVGSRLAESALYRSKSLDEILAIYNPNDDYAQKVKSVMRRIASVQ